LVYDEVLAYYSKPQVRHEIVSYCRGRWVALECERHGGKRLFLRYIKRGGKPITINEPNDLDRVFKRFVALHPRTVYASINIYRDLHDAKEIENPSNIINSTPIWDVDASLERWETAVKAAEIILDRLEKEGLDRSVFLKWSGRGIHIHINEGAFSRDLLREHNPLDISFSIVEYIMRRSKDDLTKLARKTSSSTDERPLRIENKIDLKRVFTAPLSLHRQLNLCCICFKPNNLKEFTPEWAEPSNYRHDEDWRVFEEGEGDELARKALIEIGGYDGWSRRLGAMQKRTVVQAQVKERSITLAKELKPLGRFQVMGLLQAARYYLITGDLEKAKSFGLNRAVFYAWAKRYARDRLRYQKKFGSETVAYAGERRMEKLGDEVAYTSPNGWFMIGDTEQTPRDYDRQIARRIEATVGYDKAWLAAIEYLKGFPKATLLEQRRFYNEAYKPVRDSFHKLIRREKLKRQTSLDDLLQ